MTNREILEMCGQALAQAGFTIVEDRDKYTLYVEDKERGVTAVLVVGSYESMLSDDKKAYPSGSA